MTEKQIPARKHIEEAQSTLIDLTAYVTANQQKLDLTHLQLLASKVFEALETAHHELVTATCDAETALGRL